jgi:hypothetical protein
MADSTLSLQILQEKLNNRIAKEQAESKVYLDNIENQGRLLNDFILPLGNGVKVNFSSVDVTPTTSKVQMLLQKRDASEPKLYDIHPHAVLQAAEKLDVNQSYMKNLVARGIPWQTRLSAHILNEHAQHTKRARVLVREVGGQVRGILSDKYRRMNSSEIYHSFIRNSVAAQGYVLTLRQLYYQLVSRDIVPNKQAEYSKLSTLLKEGRMAGIVDWDAIEDRLRKPSKPSSFDGPKAILEAAIQQYALPRQNGQKVYLEVIVEKDALSGVLKRVTEKYHIPILVNRGYSSASAMFDSYQRFKNAYQLNQTIKILYLGDYDPSGLDMIRDIRERILEFYMGEYDYEDIEDAAEAFDFEIIPIALTREQIEEYDPPPNPAKRTDPRADKFIEAHGATSWEVDALPPDVLNNLLDTAIVSNLDIEKFNKVVENEKKDRRKLKSLEQYL